MPWASFFDFGSFVCYNEEVKKQVGANYVSRCMLEYLIFDVINDYLKIIPSAILK